jgi:hypothetical protein
MFVDFTSLHLNIILELQHILFPVANKNIGKLTIKFVIIFPNVSPFKIVTKNSRISPISPNNSQCLFKYSKHLHELQPKSNQIHLIVFSNEFF